MTRYQAGDDVIVDFDGIEHRGSVISHGRGHVLATIVIDPLADYGSITPRLAPQSTVCVAEAKVRLIETADC